jgi:hypothetical protein
METVNLDEMCISSEELKEKPPVKEHSAPNSSERTFCVPRSQHASESEQRLPKGLVGPVFSVISVASISSPVSPSVSSPVAAVSTAVAAVPVVAAAMSVVAATVSSLSAPVLALTIVIVILAVAEVSSPSTAAASPDEEVALLHLEDALVRVDQVVDLVDQLQRDRLQAARLGAVHHHRARGVVQRGHQLLVDDHFADHRVHDGAVQLKHLRQLLHRDGVVDVRVREQVGAKRLFLDQPLQHCSHLVGLVEQIPNLK